MVTEVKNKKRLEIGNNTEKEVFYIVKKKKKKRTSSVCSQKEVQPQSGLRALREGNCRREEGRDVNWREFRESKKEERVSITNEEILSTSFNLYTENGCK